MSKDEREGHVLVRSRERNKNSAGGWYISSGRDEELSTLRVVLQKSDVSPATRDLPWDNTNLHT